MSETEPREGKETDPEKARKAYDYIMSIIRPAPPDFDPEKEREEYYKEKYGV